MYTEFKKKMTHKRALQRLALAGLLSILIPGKLMQKNEGEKSEQIFFWPPFFLPITDSLLCVNYEQPARERRVECRRPQQRKWQQGTPAQRRGHGPPFLCCDATSQGLCPSETRPLARCSCQHLAWPSLPPVPARGGIRAPGTRTSVS